MGGFFPLLFVTGCGNPVASSNERTKKAEAPKGAGAVAEAARAAPLPLPEAPEGEGAEDAVTEAPLPSAEARKDADAVAEAAPQAPLEGAVAEAPLSSAEAAEATPQAPLPKIPLAEAPEVAGAAKDADQCRGHADRPDAVAAPPAEAQAQRTDQTEDSVGTGAGE